MKYYLPVYESGNCAVIRDKDTIRVYENRPTQNSNVDYIDFYVNSHYMSISGNQTFSQYSTIPTCLNNNQITVDYFYRNDIDSILIIFLVMSIFIVYIPLKILLRLFKRVRL